MMLKGDIVVKLYPNVISGGCNIDGLNEAFDKDGNAVDVDWDLIDAEYDAQEYARNRKEEYDALNQFELISDDAINGTTTHKEAVETIKTKWPNDNSGPV